MSDQSENERSMEWARCVEIGSYLGRPVDAVLLASSEWSAGAIGPVDDAVVLFYSDAASDSVRGCLSELGMAAPLALVVGGLDANGLFDELLEILSSLPPGPHVMSGCVSDGGLKEAVAEFLRATWPAEERFAEWRRYLVVACAEDTEAFGLRLGELRELMDK